jgi:hypothetical protein
MKIKKDRVKENKTLFSQVAMLFHSLGSHDRYYYCASLSAFAIASIHFPGW